MFLEKAYQHNHSHSIILFKKKEGSRTQWWADFCYHPRLLKSRNISFTFPFSNWTDPLLGNTTPGKFRCWRGICTWLPVGPVRVPVTSFQFLKPHTLGCCSPTPHRSEQPSISSHSPKREFSVAKPPLPLTQRLHTTTASSKPCSGAQEDMGGSTRTATRGLDYWNS